VSLGVLGEYAKKKHLESTESKLSELEHRQQYCLRNPSFACKVKHAEMPFEKLK
jgi:hypothetical protein